MMNSENKKGYRHISLKDLKRTNKFYVPHVVAINNLHNIFVVAEITRGAIHSHREGIKSIDEKFIPLEVPDINGDLINSPKKKSKASKILKNAFKHEVYSSNLISAVSATESYLESVVEICLLKDPRRLSQSVKKQAKKSKPSEPEIEVKIDDSTVPLRSVLDANSLDEVYSNVIQDKLLQLMYASPSDYFGYLRNALGIIVDQDLIDDYVEIKATRDLLTHNQGYLNEIYIIKAGNKARTTDLRQRISLPPEYFKESIGIMKRLVGEIYREASKEFLGVTKHYELYPLRKDFS